MSPKERAALDILAAADAPVPWHRASGPGRIGARTARALVDRGHARGHGGGLVITEEGRAARGGGGTALHDAILATVVELHAAGSCTRSALHRDLERRLGHCVSISRFSSALHDLSSARLVESVYPGGWRLVARSR